jgi:hypothetical protein
MDGFQVRGLSAIEIVFIGVSGFEGRVLEVRRFVIKVFRPVPSIWDRRRWIGSRSSGSQGRLAL